MNKENTACEPSNGCRQEVAPLGMNLLSIFEKLDRKYGTLLFYTGLFLLLVSFLWYWNSRIPFHILLVKDLLVPVSQVLLLVRIALLGMKYPKYVCLCAVVIIVFYLSSYLNHGLYLLNLALVVAASRDADMKTILGIYLTVFLAVLFVVPVTCAMGWTGDIVKHKYGLVGHSWGFLNPNRLAFLLQMFVFLVLLYLRVRKTWIVLVVSYAAAAVIGWMTLSMTSVVVLLLFPLLYYWLKHHTVPPIWFALIPLFLTLLSIGFSMYFGPSTGDTTFESRFSIPYQIYDNQSLSVFGQDCNFVTWKEAIKKGIDPFYMNNLFLDLIVRHGLIPAFVTLVFYSRYMYRMGQLNNPQVLAMSIGVTLSGMMQLFPLFIALDFLLLYYFHQPYPQKREENARK